MLSPDGEMLCRCSKKKIRWYLDRDLAEVVSQSPLTIRLKFEPRGNGKASYPYYLTFKQNACVVCARTDFLTKHHCVPRCFRRFFPDSYKNHCSHDVLVLCDACHIKYEVFADELKNKLLKEKGIGNHSGNPKPDTAHIKLLKAASALIRHRKDMPVYRINELQAIIEGYDLNELYEKDNIRRQTDATEDTFGKQVVDSLLDISEFIQMWREHFLKTMNPKHLPEYWSVDHDDIQQPPPPWADDFLNEMLSDSPLFCPQRVLAWSIIIIFLFVPVILELLFWALLASK